MTVDERSMPQSGEDEMGMGREERLDLLQSIVSDETMSVPDRQARLEALAAQWNLPSDADDVQDPFNEQVARAISLLAEGGHR